MRYLLALVFAGLPMVVGAAEWRFETPVELTAKDAAAHFHHHDGAGRRHVAAGKQQVAVVWEDDHSGMPQVYMAVLPYGADTHAARYRLSLGGEAYEPAVVAAGATCVGGRTGGRRRGTSGIGCQQEISGSS